MSILDNPNVRQSALPISVQQYHQLGRSGIIPEPTELICGVILGKMIKSPEHTWLVQKLVQQIRESLRGDHHLRQEQPLTFANSEPEPDIAIVTGDCDQFRNHHPSIAELVIEVAIATAALDREKANVYASANIPEYWLVLPTQKHVEVFTQPANGKYSSSQIFSLTETLSWDAISISLVDLFGDT